MDAKWPHTLEICRLANESRQMTRTTTPPPDAAPPVPDAATGNWTDRWAPPRLRPYLRLARLDRPIGTWLLLFPCWWSASLAGGHLGHSAPDVAALVLFAIGALVMRGAGCTWNDIVDRDFDAKVERTRHRPIPSGQVTPKQALVFGLFLSLIGLLVLLPFNRFTIGLAIASLGLVAIYPFMKRFTYWPQFVLGLTFNWGALVGWSALTGSLALAPVALYAGSVLWTIGYDTIYAHQDAEDDLMVGLKSTALRFGEASPTWVAAFYAGAVALWGLAGQQAGAGSFFYAALAMSALHLAWQALTLDIRDGAGCLTRFRANRTVGAMLFAGLIADLMI